MCGGGTVPFPWVCAYSVHVNGKARGMRYRENILILLMSVHTYRHMYIYVTNTTDVHTDTLPLESRVQ